MEEGAATVPIGGPIANTELLVLGPGDAALPEGAEGELCIAGDGLALGYLALKSKSWVGGALLHWSVGITMDLLAIFHKGGFKG